MPRACFQKVPLEGFEHASKVECLASTVRYKRLFVGTQEGQLLSYAYNAGSSSGGSTAPQLRAVYEDTLKSSKARKHALSVMKVVENWKVLVGIVDDVIMVYDVNNFQCISQLLDTKGCTNFSVHETSSLLCVSNKRKITLYSWQGSGFIPKREIGLSESPKFILCIPGAVITGSKKHYEIIDLASFTTFRLLEAEKEHQMVGLEVPANAVTGKTRRILLSIGIQGVLMDSSSAISSSTFKEKISWAAEPIDCVVTFPNKLVTLQKGSLEVHDLMSLESVQFINFGSPSITMQPAIDVHRINKAEEQIILSTGGRVEVYVMVSVVKQIGDLVNSYNYEEAISLYRHCDGILDISNVDVKEIYEKYAYLLYSKGDYEAAAENFIAAGVAPLRFFMLFPDLVPASLAPKLQALVENAGLDQGQQDYAQTKLSGQSAIRAAAAMATFCSHHRLDIQADANKSEEKQALQGQVQFHDHEEDVVILAKLLDSMLLSALVGCSPPRKAEVLKLLKEPNRCDLEGSALLLSSHGNTLFEALMWLYRSHGEHKRVLNSMSIERSVDSSVWTMSQYFEWLAEYLRSLWYSDDGSLPSLTLQYLKEVLQHDPKLGLSVLTVRPKGSSNFGGKNVTVQEVLQLLESISNPNFPAAKEGILAAHAALSASKRAVASKKGETNFGSIAIPLANGQALGISYLEWLVGSGAAPSSMHDEFVQLIVDTISKSGLSDKIMGEINEEDDEKTLILKVFRRKLRFFLQISNKYHVEKIVKLLPPSFIHERALIKAKAGQYEDALRIYVFQLRDYALASDYCDYLYENGESSQAAKRSSRSGSMYFVMKDLSFKGIYICLFKMILAGDDEDESPRPSSPLPPLKDRIECVSRLAEVYYERIDPVDFMELLDPTTPIALIMDYLEIITEQRNAKKRNLQVIHQIMRIKEVMSRTTS